MSRLPVSYRELEFRRVDYTDRNWNQTPRISTTRDIDRILDDISRLAANEVTRQADRNCVRTVHFNIVAKDEFRNRDFDELVQFIADFIELRMFDNRIRDPYQELDLTIETAVMLHASSFISKFRELDDIVQDNRDNSFVRSWDANVGKFNAVIRDIEDMHRNDESDLRSGGTSNAYADSRRDDRYGRDASERRYASDTRASRGDDRGGRYDSGGRNDYRNDRNVREERQQYQPRNTGSSHFVAGDFEMPANEQPQSSRQSDFTEVAEAQTAKIVKQHSLSNRMNDDSAVFTGLNGSIPLLIDPNGESEMDKFKHASIYGSGISDAADMSQEIVRVFTLAQAVNEANVQNESIEKQVVVHNELSTHNSVPAMCESISNTATIQSINAVPENIEGSRQIYHTVATVDNFFVGHRHLIDFHDNMREAKSLTDVVAFFKRCLNAINVHASPESAYTSDVRGAIAFYDRVLARELNDYCVNILQIKPADPTKPLFTSVIESLDDLIAHLEKSGQDRLRNALSGFMSSIMANLIEGLNPASKVSDQVKISVASYTEAGVKPNLFGHTFFPITYTVTHLPFTMKEMGYNINGPVAITDSDVTSFIRAALDISKTELVTKPVISESLRLVITRDRQAFRLYTYPGNSRVMVLTPYPIA